MAKSLLKILAAPALVAAMMAVVSGVDASAGIATRQFGGDANPLRYMRKAKPGVLEQKKGEIFFAGNQSNSAAPRKAKEVTPDVTFEPSNNFGYLESPSGETWYYTADYEVTRAPLPGGQAYESRVTGYSFTVYDSSFKKIGSLKDEVRFQGEEIKVASVDIDMTVSRKFYNFDDKYEVGVVLMYNNPDYSVSIRTLVYSLDGATEDDGNSKVLVTIPGYPVDAVNIQPDKWSENIFMTFLTENTPDPDDFDADDYLGYLAAHNEILTTYKKVSYGSTQPQVIHEYSIPRLKLPGDQMNSPMFMLGEHNGSLTLSYFHYDKSFFVDPSGFAEDESATPDNSLLIRVFELPSLYSSSVVETSLTTIPTEIKESDKLLYTFYGVGSLTGRNDISYGVYNNADTPCFIVATDDYSLENDDMYISSYYVYDVNGERILTLDTDSESGMLLSDVRGENPQALFVHNNPSGYEFVVVDMVTGEIVTAFDQVLYGVSAAMAITSTIDRVSHCGKTYYVADMSYGETAQDGCVFARVAWINVDGTLSHIDRLNLGQRVAMAQSYLDASVLNPYVFDTDKEVEYMMLVKRYIEDGSTATREELIVVGPENGVMLDLLPSDETGALQTISMLNLASTPTLLVVYVDSNGDYLQTFYNLPFDKFNGGDGTADNPYQIATVADLQLISQRPSACYVLVDDIDAASYAFTPISNFSGTLDGNGHTVSNLLIDTNESYAGIFKQTVLNDMGSAGATVKNLVFVNPAVALNSGNTNAGLIAGSASRINVENVQVYGLKAYSEAGFNGTFGGLVGIASLYSGFSACGVTGADIDLADASVGGIAGELRTSSSVASSAFSGVINGGSAVGGIAGTTLSGDEAITDCHVDADIVAENIVGGIVGTSGRGPVTRCYVEGSIKATKTYGYNGYVSAGGVVGELSTDYAEASKSAVVSHNIVNLSSIESPATGEPAFEGQNTTVHRVVGKTSFNEAPEIVDYDDDDNPVYGDKKFAAEAFIEHNYVYDNLDVVDSSTEALHSTAEGATLSKSDVDMDFLGEHGFLFGQDSSNPWSNMSGNDPYLFFESGIIINPSDIEAYAGELFTVDIHIFGRQSVDEESLFDGFLCEYDESLVEMTGNYTFDGNVLSVEFDCKQTGVTDMTFTLLGSTATCHVTALTAGVDNIAADESVAIVFDGNTVRAEGCAIAVYNMGGVSVASGNGEVSVEGVAPGVYVAVARAASGEVSTLKIAVK